MLQIPIPTNPDLEMVRGIIAKQILNAARSRIKHHCAIR